MPTIIIRTARLSDAIELSSLSEQLGYPVQPDEMKQQLEELLPKSEHLILVAVSPTNQVIGWMHGAEQLFLEVGHHGEIVGLVVAAGQRNQGVGRLLIEHIEQWARDRNLKYVSVRSNILRPESHPFYERIGFTRVKTQHVYRKTLG